jgi:hypothetical protein
LVQQCREVRSRAVETRLQAQELHARLYVRRCGEG